MSSFRQAFSASNDLGQPNMTQQNSTLASSGSDISSSDAFMLDSAILASSLLAALPLDLVAIAKQVEQATQQRQGNYDALLGLLRLLEALHEAVRDNFFQPALPTNRQALYALLRDIETEGGWPYIPRMKLQEFLAAVDDTVDNIDKPSEAPHGMALDNSGSKD